ncbi:MAG: dipeptide ABC transporter ATP-binding protein [Prochlorotrichaceae cyanobacterium]
MNAPLLELDHLHIAYPPRGNRSSLTVPTWSVQNLSLTLNPGDRLGLVGESGCGKSTLGRAILRLLPKGSQIQGDIRFDGRSLLQLSPPQLQKFRGEAVGLVFQDPMTRLDPLMSIGEHCLETLRAHLPELSRSHAQQRVIEALESVRIPPNRWQQYPHEFSGGMRQRVAIALALILNPRLMIADEPTTSLDVTVAAEILQELLRLCTERGMALLLISHDLALVSQYCDRLAVMYAGELVETGKTQTILRSPQEEYTKALLHSALLLHQPRPYLPLDSGISNNGNTHNFKPKRSPESNLPVLLRLREVKQYYSLERNWLDALFSFRKEPKNDRFIKAVDNINLDVFQGETLGLLGESGCGKSTLCRTILRLIPPTGGKIEFEQQDLQQLTSEQLRHQRRQMQMIFQDPHACLNPLMTIGESIGDPLKIHQLAKGNAVKSKVLALLERVGLTPSDRFYTYYPHQLSGGQQQRVAIARALITNPKLLVCDEPVSMLDATVQTQILSLMLNLKKEFNLTYLFVTHDLGVARFFCDRIAVMTGGQIVELGETETVFQNPQHPYTRSLLKAAPHLGTEIK